MEIPCSDRYRNYKNICSPVASVGAASPVSPCTLVPPDEIKEWIDRYQNCYSARIDHHRSCIGEIDRGHQDYLNNLQQEIKLCRQQLNKSESRPQYPSVPQLLNRIRFLAPPSKIYTVREREEIINYLVEKFNFTSVPAVIETIDLYNPERLPLLSSDLKYRFQSLESFLQRVSAPQLQRVRWAINAYGPEAIVNENQYDLEALIRGEDKRKSSFNHRIDERMISQYVDEFNRLIDRINRRHRLTSPINDPNSPVVRYFYFLFYRRFGYSRAQQLSKSSFPSDFGRILSFLLRKDELRSLVLDDPISWDLLNIYYL